MVRHRGIGLLATLATACTSASEPVETAGSAILSERDAEGEDRFRGMLVEAYTNASPASLREDTSDEAQCVAPSSATKVFTWNAPLGQWFASVLKAELKARGVGPELWVLRTPLASGNVDVAFVGKKIERDGAPGDAAASGCGTFAPAVPLLTCRDVALDEPLPEKSCALE